MEDLLDDLKDFIEHTDWYLVIIYVLLIASLFAQPLVLDTAMCVLLALLYKQSRDFAQVIAGFLALQDAGRKNQQFWISFANRLNLRNGAD